MRWGDKKLEVLFFGILKNDTKYGVTKLKCFQRKCTPLWCGIEGICPVYFIMCKGPPPYGRGCQKENTAQKPPLLGFSQYTNSLAAPLLAVLKHPLMIVRH